jgi:SOS-response transcriptional repressor LexA
MATENSPTTTHAKPTLCEPSKQFPPGIEAFLPSVFEVVITDDALAGKASMGDTLRVRRDIAPRAGDGVLVRAGAHYLARIYLPTEDGDFCVNPTTSKYATLYSEVDDLQIIGVVVGAPACRWSASHSA